jgi:serine/threonine protein kinase
MLTKLKHENVIQFVDCYEDNRRYYLITELPGKSWPEIPSPYPIQGELNL